MSTGIELIDYLECALSCWLRPGLNAEQRAALDDATISQVLTLADQIGREKLLPSARLLDLQPPAMIDGLVHTPAAQRSVRARRNWPAGRRFSRYQRAASQLRCANVWLLHAKHWRGEFDPQLRHRSAAPALFSTAGSRQVFWHHVLE